MTVITSRHHPIVKHFRELAHAGGPVMLLDGWHVITEAMSAGISLDTLAVCGPVTRDEQTVIDRAGVSGTQVIEVSEPVLNAMSPVTSPTGVVASARKPAIDAKTLVAPGPALVLAGIGIQDPGNAGAVIRSAAAAGATGVIVDETTADPWSWKALRASMGSVFRVPVIRTQSLVSTVDAWHTSGLRVLAAVPRDGVAMSEVDLTVPTVIALGGEGPGLPMSWVDRADTRICIPMQRGVESLNVAVAAALILYEARRQRALGAPKPCGEGGR